MNIPHYRAWIEQQLAAEAAMTPGPWRGTFDMAAMRGPSRMLVATFDCMGQHKRIIATGLISANEKGIAAMRNQHRALLLIADEVLHFCTHDADGLPAPELPQSEHDEALDELATRIIAHLHEAGCPEAEHESH